MMERTVTDSSSSFNKKRGLVKRNPTHFERENHHVMGFYGGRASSCVILLREAW